MEQQINTLLHAIEVEGCEADKRLINTEYLNKINEMKREIDGFSNGIKHILKQVDEINASTQQEALERRKSVTPISADESKAKELEDECTRLEEEIQMKLELLEAQTRESLVEELPDPEIATLRSEVLKLELLEAMYLQAANLIPRDDDTYFRLNPPLTVTSKSIAWKEVWQL